MISNHDLKYLINRTAYRLRNQHVPVDDIRQELWRWTLEHPERVETYTEDPKDRRLGKSLYHAGRAYIARERAQRSGYRADDQYYYSTKLLGDVLIDVLMTLEDDVPYPSIDEGTSYMDISGAYDKLSPQDQETLFEYYSADDAADLAAGRGVDEDTLRSQAHRALGRLQRLLGGPAPTAHLKELAPA